MLADLPAYMETPAGESYLKQFSELFHLKPGDKAFIPFGVMVLPLFSPPEKISLEPWAYVWHMPMYVEEWAKEVAPEVMYAIAEFNRSHFAANSSRRMWQSRSEILERFLSDIRAAPER